MHQQRGYILFITFSILALCTALVSAFLVKGLTHKKLAIALLEQEQLQQFTLSTPALAQSYLAFSAAQMKSLSEQEKKQSEEKLQDEQAAHEQSPAGQEFAKLLLEKVLPVVNKPQKFMLKEIDNDLPAMVNLTFCCESGKININGLYDLANKKFLNEGMPGRDQKIFATWIFDKIAALTEKPSLFGPFVEHVKQRKAPFNDVTELLEIKEFATCFRQAVFYDQSDQKEQVGKPGQKLFLTDIFTVSSEHDTIQPWLLSPSVCALLDIKQIGSKQADSEKKEEKKVDISSFKIQADWAKDWDVLLKPLYGVGFDKIPEQVRFMLATQFSVSVFSILVTVKTQVEDSESSRVARIFAILKQKKLPDSSIMYDVIKIYQV